MHDSSFLEMSRLVDKYIPKEKIKVADLGSWSWGGPKASFRELAHYEWDYVGLDIRGDKEHNVDVVMPGKYEIPFEDGYFDAMISGSTLEHVHNPWKLMIEAARVVKKGGIFVFGAPFIQGPHDEFDGYRFLPKGLRALFNDVGIKRLTSHLVYVDTYLSAFMTERENRVNVRIADSWIVGEKSK
jgi:SAM-dependent methyltransferase